MTRIPDQPAPTRGSGDVWVDVLRAVTAPLGTLLRVSDDRTDSVVLYLARNADDPWAWWFPGDPWPPEPGLWRRWIAPVAADMAERRDLGIARYGTPLQYGNGRDPWVDAYQEALDLVAYLWQARAPWWMRWAAVGLAVAIRRHIHTRSTP